MPRSACGRRAVGVRSACGRRAFGVHSACGRRAVLRHPIAATRGIAACLGLLVPFGSLRVFRSIRGGALCDPRFLRWVANGAHALARLGGPSVRSAASVSPFGRSACFAGPTWTSRLGVVQRVPFARCGLRSSCGTGAATAAPIWLFPMPRSLPLGSRCVAVRAAPECVHAAIDLCTAYMQLAIMPRAACLRAARKHHACRTGTAVALGARCTRRDRPLHSACPAPAPGGHWWSEPAARVVRACRDRAARPVRSLGWQLAGIVHVFCTRQIVSLSASRFRAARVLSPWFVPTWLCPGRRWASDRAWSGRLGPECVFVFPTCPGSGSDAFRACWWPVVPVPGVFGACWRLAGSLRRLRPFSVPGDSVGRLPPRPLGWPAARPPARAAVCTSLPCLRSSVAASRSRLRVAEGSGALCRSWPPAPGRGAGRRSCRLGHQVSSTVMAWVRNLPMSPRPRARLRRCGTARSGSGAVRQFPWRRSPLALRASSRSARRRRLRRTRW